MLSLFILEASSNPIISIAPMIIMFVIIYFFFIRPQAKKQKEQINFQNSISVGDNICSASGIVGKITKIDGNEVVIESEGRNQLRMLKSAISKEMTELQKK